MNTQDREEFTYLKVEVDHIKADVAEIKTITSNVNDSMKRITYKLFNDDLTGEEGIIAATQRNGVRLTKLENVKVAVITVLFALGSAFGWIANNLLSKQ